MIIIEEDVEIGHGRKVLGREVLVGTHLGYYFVVVVAVVVVVVVLLFVFDHLLSIS